MLAVYAATALVVLFYAVLLYVLNRLPQITVKSLGWLLFKRVTIRLGTTTVTAKVIKLNVNLFRAQNSPRKLFYLQLEEVQVLLNHEPHKDRPDPPPEPLSEPEKPKSLHDVEEALSFCILKRIYDIFVRNRLLNQFNIHLLRVAVLDHATTEETVLFLEYIRVEDIVRRDGSNKLVLTLVNGAILTPSLPDACKDADVKLFKNLEFVVRWDLIEGPTNGSRVSLKLDHFGVSLSVSGVHLPVDTLLAIAKEGKSQKSHVRLKRKPPVSLDVALAISKKLSTVELRVDDLNAFYNIFTLSTSGFVTTVKQEDTNALSISTYLTSIKLLHDDAQCFELPSATYRANSALAKWVTAAHNIASGHSHKEQDFGNFDSNLIMSGPRFDVYFDQIEFLMSNIKHAPKKDEIQTNDHRPLSFLRQFNDFSNKVVIVDTKLCVHFPNPARAPTKFSRDSETNLQLNADLLSVVVKVSTRNFRKKFHCDSSGQGLHVNGYARLKNFKYDIAGNSLHLSKVNALVRYNIAENKASVKLSSKNIKLMSVNKILFHVIGKLRERRMSLFNEKCAKLLAKLPKVLDEPSEENKKVVMVELFKLIPSFIVGVKVNLTNLQADIICNDGLPSLVSYDESLDQEVDLGDFKRGVSFRANDILFNYKEPKEEISANIKLVQCFTLSEYDTEYIPGFDEVAKYQVTDSDFTDVSSLESASSFARETEGKKSKRVLTIKDITITNKDTDINELALHIPEIDGRFDIFLVWCVIYAKHLMHYFAPAPTAQFTNSELSQITVPSKKVKLSVTVDSLAVVARIPNEVDILLEMDGLRMSNCLINKEVYCKFVRLLVVHPSTKLWTRFLVLKDIVAQFLPGETLVDSNINVTSSGMRINIPHQFLVYTVIDNIITMAKAVKQIEYNFERLGEGSEDFDRILPLEKPAVVFPHVNVKTDVLALTIENDPFDTELGHIFEIGLLEQKNRLKKQELFEKRCAEIRSSIVKEPEDLTYTQPTQSRLANSSTPRHTSPLRQVVSDGTQSPAYHCSFKERIFNKKRAKAAFNVEENIENEGLTKEEAEALISTAEEMLNRDFSTCWINKIRKFREVKVASWKRRASRTWKGDLINPLITSKFDIQDYSTGPCAMGAIFRGLDLTLCKATIEDIDQFLYDRGKGQPKFTYSILVPLFIHLRSKMFYVFLRDYALPLVSFPPNADPLKYSVDFRGNFVVNEQLATTKEEMRFIYVPFSPAAPYTEYLDNFYSVFVPRTLTPVKFMVDMHCDLASDKPCVMTWCKSYSPALLAATSALDNFTKPEVDDSPIGWWDKVALLLHGKLTFNIANELCFHVKSSVNPYDLMGKASGFVFCWKNNVKLKINDTGKPNEIIILESDDFLLAVPNYSVTEKKTWSLFYEEIDDVPEDADTETKKYLKRVIKLSSDEKVTWKLGLLFERNKNGSHELSNDQERTDTFKPHYDIVVTNPRFDYHPDSYTSYRSDYLHLAISVISKSAKGNCYNAAYLTPLTFHYFFYWWDTISDGVSLPIRNGPLFTSSPVGKSHVKMSNHISTVKYQLVFEPLSISHMYLHSTGDESSDKFRVAFTGLKGKFAKCYIDLHQRKELVRYVNEKLSINNKIYKLKMNQGEIIVDEADIRLVSAIFNDESIMGRLMALMAKQPDGKHHHHRARPGLYDTVENHKDWMTNIEITDNDFSWIDLDDFVEMEERDVLSPYPKIKVFPFFFTPKFSYFREFSILEDGAFPFGNEASHDCLLGLNRPGDTQDALLRERIRNIRKDLSYSKELLAKLEASNDPEFAEDITRTKMDISIGNEKLNVVESIWEAMTGKQVLGTSSSEDVSSNVSRRLTNYSSQRSYNQLKEVSEMHSCVSDFHNRFIIHNMQLKWDKNLRDLFMNYVQKVSDRKSHVYYMSHRAVDLVESVLNNPNIAERSTLENDFFDTQYTCGQDIISGFEDVLEQVADDNYGTEHKYLLKLIHPQIQLVSDKDEDSCVLVTSRDLEMRIVGVNLKGYDDVISSSQEMSAMIETRYGVLFKDSHIFVFKKDEHTITHPDKQYGNGHASSNVNWPPWIECEVCYDSSWLKDQLVVERNSMALIYKKPNDLSSEKKAINLGNEITLYLAKVVINATSDQYSTIYYIVTDLLVHGKTNRDAMLERLDKVVALSETSDFAGLDTSIKKLQERIRTYQGVFLKLDDRAIPLSRAEKEQAYNLEVSLARMKLELVVLMRGLGMRSSKHNGNKHTSRFWNILADQVIWHLLESKREPFIDFALASSKYHRVDSFDGSNINKVEISMIQGFNLQANAVYPELLGPFKDAVPEKNEKERDPNAPIIAMGWKILDPIGGIPIMQHAKLEIMPLKVLLDYQTSKRLFEYVFPKEDNETDDDETDSEESHASELVLSKNPIKHFLSKKRSSESNLGLRESMDILSTSPSSVVTGSFVSSSDAVSETSERGTSKKTAKKERKSFNLEEADDIAIIMNRLSQYISIVDIEIVKVPVSVSFKAPKHLNILDVHNLVLTIPNLRYKNKMWSGEDFILRLRKDIIKIIVHHSGRILGNKFKIKKRRIISEPLKQIADYASFMTIQDLQLEGRSRDASKTDNGTHHHRHHHHHNLKKTLSHASAFAFESVFPEPSDDDGPAV